MPSVAVVNVFEGLNPTLINRLPSPAPATAVACGDCYAAVAAAAPECSCSTCKPRGGSALLRQVRVGPAVQCVAVAANLGLAGTERGEVVVFDLTAGLQRDRLRLGNATVQDLVVAGDQFYALTAGRLHVLGFEGAR